MGPSVKRAVLLCSECFANIYTTNALVAGSADPNDFRCPECGSGLFNCGYCLHPATKLVNIDGATTWNCKNGCNP